MATPHPQPIIEHKGEPKVKRFSEQRWTIDNIIQANGIDWDQARSLYLQAPCGIESLADFAGIRQRVKKMADIGPAFETIARRREQKARLAEEAGEMITARDNYFMAAVHWGGAQWTFDENNEQNIFLNQKKRACFANYARLADHRVEPVWIPFKDTALPAWYHLPPDYVDGTKVPAVVSLPGMDSFKEIERRAPRRPLARSRHRRARGRRAGAIRIAASRHSRQHGELDCRRTRALRLAVDAARDRRAAYRRRRQQLRLVLRYDHGRQRAALSRRGRVRDLLGARLPYDLRRGLADLQEALHVDGRLYRRSEVRRIHQGFHLGRPCRAHPMPLSLPRRRGRRAIAAQPYRKAVRAAESIQAPRRLSGCPALASAACRPRRSAPTRRP